MLAAIAYAIPPRTNAASFTQAGRLVEVFSVWQLAWVL